MSLPLIVIQMISLISTFFVRRLDSIISLVSILVISCLYLDSVAEQAGLSLTSSKTPDRFSRDEAQINIEFLKTTVKWTDS